MNIMKYIRNKFYESYINKIVLFILINDLIITLLSNRPNIYLIQDFLILFSIIGVNYWYHNIYKFENYANLYIEEFHRNENEKLKNEVISLKLFFKDKFFKNINIMNLLIEVEQLYKDNITLIEQTQRSNKYIVKNLLESLNKNYKETINSFKDLASLISSFNYLNNSNLNEETKLIHKQNEESIFNYLNLLNDVIENYKLSIASIPSATSNFQSFDDNTKQIEEQRNIFLASTKVQQNLFNNNINNIYNKGEL